MRLAILKFYAVKFTDFKNSFEPVCLGRLKWRETIGVPERGELLKPSDVSVHCCEQVLDNSDYKHDRVDREKEKGTQELKQHCAPGLERRITHQKR